MAPVSSIVSNASIVSKARRILGGVFLVIAALYPFLVFYFLVIRKTPLRLVSLFLTGFALTLFLAATGKKKRPEPCLPAPPSSFSLPALPLSPALQ